MSHPPTDLLEALAYGMLEDERVGEVATHVAACQRCERLYRAHTHEAELLERSAAASQRHAPTLRVTAPSPRWLVWTAAAAVLLALLSLSWKPGPETTAPDKTAPDKTAPIIAELQLERTVPSGLHELRDGSLVNASAPIHVRGWREIDIGPGDYFFHVAPRPSLPFLIHTPNGLVTVVGTKFRLLVEDSTMNTKSAALLAVAVISGAVIIANSKGTLDVQSGQEALIEGDAAPTRVSAGNSGQPSLERASPQGQMAQLEAQLLEAREQIKALQNQMDGHAPEVAADLDDPVVLASTQSRFFALKEIYQSGSPSEDEMSELLTLSKNKRLMKHIVRGLEKKITDNPDNLDARLQLADVESSRVHIAESITERAMFGKNVRQQIQEVLKRDPENWQGRFMRAVGISHSQRTPQGRASAIKEFESLLALQQGNTPEPKFAQTYEQLAVVYLAERDTTKARATVQAGLEAYPDAKDLQELLERLSKDDG